MVRVPLADAAAFWTAVAPGDKAMGRTPRHMMVRAAIGFAIGAFLGGLSGGVGGAVGLGAGIAVVAAILPVLPEVDAVRALLGQPAGERFELRRDGSAVVIEGEWTRTHGDVRRLRGRIHVRAGRALLNLPAAAFPADGLSELLESA